MELISFKLDITIKSNDLINENMNTPAIGNRTHWKPDDGGESRMTDMIEYIISKNLWIYISPIILIVGTVGSILSLLVLNRKALRVHTTMFYLAVLAASDLTVLYTGFLRFWLENAMGIYIRLASPVACKLHTFLVYISLDFSVWILVAMSIDRCLYISKPYWAKKHCTLRNSRYVIAIIIVLDILINMHFLWTYDIGKVNSAQIYANDGIKCYAPSDSPLTVTFVQLIWPWIDLCVYCLFPFVIMAVSNFLIVQQLIRTEKTMLAHKMLFFNRRKKQVASENSPGSCDSAVSNLCHSANSNMVKNKPDVLLLHQQSVADETNTENPSDVRLHKQTDQKSDVNEKPRLSTMASIMSALDTEDNSPKSGGETKKSCFISKDLEPSSCANNKNDGTPVGLQLEIIPSGARTGVSAFSDQSFPSLQLEPPLYFADSFEGQDDQQESDFSKFGQSRFISQANHRFSKEDSQDVLTPTNVITKFEFSNDEETLIPGTPSNTIIKNSPLVVKRKKMLNNKVHPDDAVHVGDDRNNVKGHANLAGTSGSGVAASRPTSVSLSENLNYETDFLVCNDDADKYEDGGDVFQASSLTKMTNLRGETDVSVFCVENGDLNSQAQDNKDKRDFEKKTDKTSRRGNGPPQTETSHGVGAASMSGAQTAFREMASTSISRSKTASVTQTLLVITLMFWLFNSPVVIYVIGYSYWESGTNDRLAARLKLGWSLVNIIQYVNNALHVFIYCLTSPKFRHEFIEMFKSLATTIRQCKVYRSWGKNS